MTKGGTKEKTCAKKKTNSGGVKHRGRKNPKNYSGKGYWPGKRGVRKGSKKTKSLDHADLKGSKKSSAGGVRGGGPPEKNLKHGRDLGKWGLCKNKRTEKGKLFPGMGQGNESGGKGEICPTGKKTSKKP